jgi:hypothetical protein
MSWLFSRALVAEYSADTCSAGEPFAPLNGTATPQAFCAPDRMTAFSRPSRFGMTFGALTERLGADLLTWFLAASPARTSALPEKATGSTGNAPASGRTWRGSFAKYDPASHSWKTAQLSLLADSDEFSQTWPRWGAMRDGESYLLPTPTRPTCANESGLLPTLTVCGNYNRKGASPTSGDGLATALAKLPTLCARDYRSPGRSRLERTGGTHGECLPQVIGGPLNPTWCEWFMGFPLGWTELQPLAMPKFQQWRASHGANSPNKFEEQAA